MKRTYIKKVLGDFFKALDQNYKKCEVMELSMKTCITRKAELFVRVEGRVNVPDQDKSFLVTKDYDL